MSTDLANAAAVDVTIAEGVTQCLLREGIDRVFGIPGSYFLAMFDAFQRAELRSVEGRHEGAAACMAAGYAQASGQVGVVYTACGPGTTNALTGFAGAYADSIPMLLLASQIPRNEFGRDGQQESTGLTHSVDQVDIYRSVSHFSGRVTNPESAIRLTRTALRTSIARRGPTVLEFPSDLLGVRIPFRDTVPEAYRSESRCVDVQGIEDVCRLLRSAKLPAIVVGNRAVHVGAAADLLKLCEEQRIPCASVNYTKGAIPEDHPLSLGVIGNAGQAVAEDYLARSDLVIALGVRLSGPTTLEFDEESFKNLVQIDPDAAEIGRSLPLRLGIVSSIPAAVRALLVALRGTKLERDPAPTVAALKKQFALYDEPDSRADTTPLTPPRALRIVRENIPRDTLIVGDTGATMVSTSRYLPSYAPDGFFALYTLAPMGSCLPLSIGVQIARPDATVLGVMGDGAFLVHTGELSVAVQHRLPVIHLVLNNGSYKSVADRQVRFYGRTYATTVPSPDYVQLAQSFGCDGYRARTADELRAAIRTAVAARHASVIEVPVDPAFVNPLPRRMATIEEDLFKDRKTSTEWPFRRTRSPR